jgi:murein DD-endopeptidase MepM/ murein hydrolase activator NlpD
MRTSAWGEIPKSKIQIPNKFQSSKSKRATAAGWPDLNFAAWNLFGIWILGFGISAASPALAQPFRLPTANNALFERGNEEKFFVGTSGKPWQSGTFGCVRSEGYQMHEGLDIRAIKRDKRGEPLDPVIASCDGTVSYINKRAGASNYGKYVVLKHVVEGIEVFTLYAHLSDFASGLAPGKPVKAGETIATMGRTSNTRERISTERAHVHFEINLFVSDRFSTWYRKEHPKEPDDHGIWNGVNLIGLDPRLILLEQEAQGAKFSLLKFIKTRPELCRVIVRDANFSFPKRYSMLIRPNPLAQKEGVAGYEIALDANAVPIQLTPRAASELKSKQRYQLYSVNAAEEDKNPCRKLVARRGNAWELTNHGITFLNLLTE